jgi:quinol monooxygenase YgiN
MHTISATFTFLTSEKRDTFLNILNSPDGLAVTRVWPGCVSIECYTVQDNENQVVLWEKWNKQADHEKYMSMRKETGMFDLLENLLAKPFEVVRLSEEVVSPPLHDGDAEYARTLAAHLHVVSEVEAMKERKTVLAAAGAAAGVAAGAAASAVAGAAEGQKNIWRDSAL